MKKDETDMSDLYLRILDRLREELSTQDRVTDEQNAEGRSDSLFGVGVVFGLETSIDIIMREYALLKRELKKKRSMSRDQANDFLYDRVTDTLNRKLTTYNALADIDINNGIDLGFVEGVSYGLAQSAVTLTAEYNGREIF